MDVYINALGGDFVMDDEQFIKDNAGVHNLSNLGEFFVSTNRTASTELKFDVYRPITIISFASIYAIFGSDPFPYHLINVIFHGLTVALVFFLCRRIMQDDIKSFFAAAIFALHPVQTETVSIISNLSNILSMFFLCASFLLYLKSDEYWRRSGRVLIYFASLLFYLASIFSKEAGIVLPGLILIYYYFIRSEKGHFDYKRHIVKLSPFVVSAIIFFISRSMVLGKISQRGMRGGSLPAHIVSILMALAEYLKVTIFPLILKIEYYVPEYPTIFEIVLTLLFVAATVLCAWLLRRKSPVYMMGVCWFFIALLPVINIIPIRTFANERFLYMPVVGFALFATQGIFDALSTFKLRHAVVVLLIFILSLYSTRTIIRNRDFANDFRLWSVVLNDNPRSVKAMYNLAVIYESKGEIDKAKEYYGWTIQSEGLLQLLGRLGMARILLAQGDVKAAMSMYEDIVRLFPDRPEAFVKQGQLYMSVGEYKLSEKMLLKALEISPDSKDAQVALKALYKKAGWPDISEEHIKRAQDLKKGKR